MTLEEIEEGMKDVPSVKLEKEGNIVDVLTESKIASSKREAREFITNGSITINGEKITDLEFSLNKDIAIEGKVIIVRRGKKKYTILRIEEA